MRTILILACAAMLTAAPALAQTTPNGTTDTGTTTATVAPGATANAMVSPAPGSTSGVAGTGTGYSNPNAGNVPPVSRSHTGWWGLLGLIGLFGLLGRGRRSTTTVR